MQSVGRKCGQKWGDLIAQAIALVIVVLGVRTGWVHENFRPLSLVLSVTLLLPLPPAHRFLSYWAPQPTVAAQDPQKHRVQDHCASEPPCPILPPSAQTLPSLWMWSSSWSSENHWGLLNLELLDHQPGKSLWKIPGVFMQYRKSPKGEKIICECRKSALKIWKSVA